MGTLGAVESILIVEDHPLFADAIVGMLHGIDSSLHIRICTTAAEALVAFGGDRSWSRIILDVDVPGANGLSLVRQFASLGAASRCVVITGSDNSQWQAQVMSLGMLGYIVKSAQACDFAAALKKVMKGTTVMLASAAECVRINLTRRQQDMLCLLQRGYTSKSIAMQLCLSVGTVDNHIGALLRALGARNRTEAISKGIALGYIEVLGFVQNSQQTERV